MEPSFLDTIDSKTEPGSTPFTGVREDNDAWVALLARAGHALDRFRRDRPGEQARRTFPACALAELWPPVARTSRARPARSRSGLDHRRLRLLHYPDHRLTVVSDRYWPGPYVLPCPYVSSSP